MLYKSANDVPTRFLEDILHKSADVGTAEDKK